MDEFYNRHYIRVDECGCITEGWSDGPNNSRAPAPGDICINEQGGYQFRLKFADGTISEENPALYDFDGMIPLYAWDGARVIARTAEEIEADRAALPTPEAPKTVWDELDEAYQEGVDGV